jgi:hypothetical protein
MFNRYLSDPKGDSQESYLRQKEAAAAGMVKPSSPKGSKRSYLAGDLNSSV